jgi:hypothetical protein
MVRTQVQLSDQQLVALRALAAREGVSIAELVRRGVEQLLRGRHGPDPDERKKRALEAIGKFRSRRSDVSENHDRYLADAFRR